ncbi:hypothetical protein BYT27DRAFT_7203644 [Phlegmacium glaucopus]|nr:hypothetical protein BYT27DRAFT_7203644 [Phlegmacium glaucopus]
MPVSAADVDRLFLQAVLSRGLLSSTLAQSLWEKSIDAVNASNNSLNIPNPKDKDSWNAFVAKINRSLDKLDLEFRHMHDELSGKEMYAIVNRKGDEIAQMATDYTPAEITFFKAIVEQIILAPREAFSVSSLAALRELNAAKINMTKSQAEIILASFVSKGWLLKSKRGRYSLSTRALLELLPYLKSTYPEEILECTICMEILTRGVGCHTPNCKIRMHHHCLVKFRRQKNSCPACKAAWPQDAKDKQLLPVGEEAAKDGQDGKRQTRMRSVEQSEEEDAEGEEDPQPSQESTPQNGARKGRRKPVRANDSMEVHPAEDVEPSQPRKTRRSSRR